MEEEGQLKQFGKVIIAITNDLDYQCKSMEKVMKDIQLQEERGTLTIPYLKASFEKGLENREDYMKRANSFEKRLIYYSDNSFFSNRFMSESDQFLEIFDRYKICVNQFVEFTETYRYFVPKNGKDIQEQVKERLLKKGYVVDSNFEGDYATWVGVYARPEDKPTYLDASTAEEAALQNKYRVDGFKRDFSEWFEWEINEGKISE